ncbi:unnamed protein product [Effrenium voratum]|nr:unnamed protein product [Effrenium voratum]
MPKRSAEEPRKAKAKAKVLTANGKKEPDAEVLLAALDRYSLDARSASNSQNQKGTSASRRAVSARLFWLLVSTRCRSMILPVYAVPLALHAWQMDLDLISDLQVWRRAGLLDSRRTYCGDRTCPSARCGAAQTV